MSFEIEIYNQYEFDLKGRTSGKIKTTCPFCSHERKKQKVMCATVWIDEGTYHCNHCERKGSLHKYKNNKISMMKTYKIPNQDRKFELDEVIIDNFRTARGIKESTLVKCKVSSGKHYMPKAGKETRAIEFNYFRDGKLVNVKYKAKNKDFKLEDGAELIFYNIDSIKNSDYVIITEGEEDCLSFVQAGYESSISVPNGANIGKMDYLDSSIEQFDEISKIYLATDNDKKGIDLRNELARRFGFDKCFIVDFKDCKDANEYMVKNGVYGLSKCVEEAKEIPIDGVFNAETFFKDVYKVYYHGYDVGMPLGISPLDELVRWQKGRLCIVTGIPSHGKGEFTDILMSKLSINHNVKWGVYSPENYPISVHIIKLVEKISGKSMAGANKISESELDMVMEYINDNFFFIMSDNELFSIEDILERASMMVRKHGISGLIIDPWNMIEHKMEKGQSETNYISKILDKISYFAKKNNVLTVLVAHPTKMEKSKDSDFFKVPSLYSISGSSNFYNKCDYGITIYRNLKADEVEVHVQKVRFKWLGNIGFVNTKYNSVNGRFSTIVGDVIFHENKNWLGSHAEVKTENYESPIRNTFYIGDKNEEEAPF